MVFGALTSDGRVDKNLMAVARLLSEGMTLTFHRAFDVCTQDLHAALEDIISLGCDRVLTSGRAANASDGSSNLSKLVAQARGRIQVVAGCGITADNVQVLIEDTGVHGVHAGGAVTEKLGGSCLAGDSAPTAGFTSSDMSEWECVSCSKVQMLVSNAKRGWGVAVDDAPNEEEEDEDSNHQVDDEDTALETKSVTDDLKVRVGDKDR